MQDRGPSGSEDEVDFESDAERKRFSGGRFGSAAPDCACVRVSRAGSESAPAGQRVERRL